MVIYGGFDPARPDTYDVLDYSPVGSADERFDLLPVGTRIRFEKTVWMVGHLGGSPVAFGRILDPPFKSHLVNLARVSTHSANHRVGPDAEFLSEVVH